MGRGVAMANNSDFLNTIIAEFLFHNIRLVRILVKFFFSIGSHKKLSRKV